MGPIPFALSIGHFVSSVGADAGFAAIIGLAILVLLYFAQARETASLRDREAQFAERVQQLELRVAQLSRASAAPTGTNGPAPSPASATSAPVPSSSVAPAPAGPLVTAPAAPAGVGAPALSAATRLIPSGDEGPISIRATGAAAPQAAVTAPPGPPPATAAGSGNGVRTSPPTPAPVPAAARTAQPPPRAPARATSRTAAATSRRPAPAPPRGPRMRWGALVIAGLLGLAAIVVALLLLTSGGGSTPSSNSSGALSKAAGGGHRGSRSSVALNPAAVAVVVLNGTSTSNLAHDVSQRLAGAGFKTGTPATAPDQTQTATVVGYRAGERRAAVLVARSLKLGPASVQAVSQGDQAVACPQTSVCTAQVIVTVGSDLASSATTTSPAAPTSSASTT